jgi:hypothetical protein
MKEIILLFFVFCFYSSYSQQKTLSLEKLLLAELKNLTEHQHGNHYMVDNKMASEKRVKQNLLYIKSISRLDLKKYKVKTIQTKNHTVRIFKAINKETNVGRFVEIKSVYTSFDKKRQYNYSNYYIVTKKKPMHIQLSFDENGISGYLWGNSEFYVSRESIILVEDTIEEIDTQEKKVITDEANKAYHLFKDDIDKLKTQYFK